MLLNKAFYWRLSNAFDLERFIEGCPMLLNKVVYRRLSNAFE